MQPGQTVAHYEILGTVGEGGMGVVYKARDTKLDRIVALKFLPPGASRDARAKKRFVNEAKTASSLDHPNICTIHDIAETDEGQLYIVMAYYEGRTLQERLGSETFTVERSLGICRQLALALARAHGAGIVHRDLKPANVMVGDGDEVKLLDFGVAKLTLEENITATLGAVGTIAYMSPEQLNSEEIDGRTDLWALGTVMHEMLGGSRPFQGDTTAALIHAILYRDPEPLEQLRPDVPEAVADLIRSCLDKDREGRPAGAAEVSRFLAGPSSATWEDMPTRTVETKMPKARPRSRLVFLVLIPLILAAAVVYWTQSPFPPKPGEPGSADVLAVLPFSVRGSADLEYLGEGIVDLLSARLEGIGGLATVDPRVVIARVRKDGLDLSDPQTGAVLASRVGAGRYVTGDLLAVGERVTLTASMQEAGESGAPAGKATVEGDATDVFALIDELVIELVTGTMSAPGDRLTKTAALTSQSFAATKSYLLGEQLIRKGNYREAAEAYDAAIGQDSTFALAFYRKSIVGEWIDAPDARSTVDRALDLADRLPPRERDLLEALYFRRHGRNREAEQAYRAILHRDPDELEALTQLGEVLFHDNPRVGRSMFESEAPFARTSELEPVNANARIHLARLYALSGDTTALRTTAELFATETAESERALEVESMYAFSTADSVHQAAVVERLATMPAPHLFYAAHGVNRFVRSAAGAQQILEAGNNQAPLLLGLQAGLYLEQGKLEQFDDFLAGIPEGDSAGWDLYRVYALTSGAMPADKQRMSELMERLRDVSAENIIQTSWLPPYEDRTPEFSIFERDFHVALLAIHSDRVDEARQLMRKMEAMGPFPGLGSIQPDALKTLESEIQVWAGDDAAALATLRAMEYEIPHAMTIRAIADGARSRFLRAEVERRAGDLQVAKAYYLGLDQSWSWWDTVFRPRVYRALAEIAVQEERPKDAIEYYSRLLELWRDVDPVLYQKRSEVQEALAAVRES